MPCSPSAVRSPWPVPSPHLGPSTHPPSALHDCCLPLSDLPPMPSAIREWCLAFHDIRANVLEVVNRWDELQHMAGLPLYEQQLVALECLQIYAPLGHALGLGTISALMEDTCFKASKRARGAQGRGAPCLGGARGGACPGAVRGACLRGAWGAGLGGVLWGCVQEGRGGHA